MVRRGRKRRSSQSRKFREHAAGIFIIFVLAAIGTIMQVNYIKEKATRQAAFVICNECKGTGLADNTGNPHPTFPYGAIPQFKHLLESLQMGYQLEEIACPVCRGLGLVENLEGDTSVLARQYLDAVDSLLVKNKLAVKVSGDPDFETKRQDFIGIQTLGKVDAKLEKVECPECGGRGETARYPDEPDNEEKTACTVCYGVGYRYIKRLENRPDLCPSCAGLGRIVDIENGRARTCRRCNGFGLVKAEKAEE